MLLIVDEGVRYFPFDDRSVHGHAGDALVHDGPSQSDGEVGADGRRFTATVDGADR